MAGINDFGSESKIPLTEKHAPVLEEGDRDDGPAWEKTSFPRSTERVCAEEERQDQDPASDVSATGPLTMTSTSNSKPDFDDDTEQAPANNEVGSGQTNERMYTCERLRINETYSHSINSSMEQSAGGGLRSLASEGSDEVDVPSRRKSGGQDNGTSWAESSCFPGGVSRQGEDDGERPGLSMDCGRSDSPENTTSALLVVENSVKRTRSCTTQLDGSQQGGRAELTSLANARGVTEQASQGEHIGEFHALLREAMQQSDAELAAEKESACTFKRQLSLPAFIEHSRPHQCGSPPEALQSATSTPNIAEDCYLKDCGSGGTDCVSSAAHMDAPLPASAAPVSLAETTQGKWVRYVSPEGYAYLYNEVTGSSQWADPSEEELHQAHKAVDTAADTGVGTGRGAVNNMAEAEKADVNDEDTGVVGTGSLDTDREERANVAEEGGSAHTIEASQTSQDTSDPDARNSAGKTAMHLAAAQHSVRGLLLLLTGGANVNATDERGRTPLHLACENFRTSSNDHGSDQSRECIELLLSRGAMEDARDAKGQTPLHISALAGNLGAAQALVGAGAIASADAAGNSPLHLAAAQGHSEIIQLLVLGNRTCYTRNSSSVASEEAPPPKSAYDEGSGACAATELITEGTDASGSVSEARYRLSDRPPLADGRYPLDHAVADSRLGEYLSGGTDFQTPDDLYRHNPAGTSRRKQQLGLTGAEIRAKTEISTDVEDSPTTFDADITMKLKRPEKLSTSHPVDGPEAVERQWGSHEGRKERRIPVETHFETRHVPTVSASAPARENRRSWDEGLRNLSLPHRRHDDRLGQEVDRSELSHTGPNTFERREWPSKNVGDTNKSTCTEGGSEDGLRKRFPDHDRMRQRPEVKEGKTSRRARRRRGSDRENRENPAFPWPEALPPDTYEQTVGAVLATRGEDSDPPSYSASTEAFSAACVASQLDDAAAVLHLLEFHGLETPDIVYEGGRTPLHHACRGDDISLVRLLCRARADPEARDFQGNSPLIVAAATGSTACLRFLLQGGIDPHGCNKLGDTPLHVAAWHGNISCVKALVGGGARLGQRNRSGLTAREGLLNAGPTFFRGRPSKIIRATLKYLECAEASATQPKLSTWTSQDGYDSDFTAVTAASRTSPERSDGVDIADSKADIPPRRGISNSEAARGALLSCPGGTRTPAAPGDRALEGERNWERWKPREEGGVREGRSEGDAMFRESHRRNSDAEVSVVRNGNLRRAEPTQLHEPHRGEYATNRALSSNGSRASNLGPSRERYNPSYSVAEGDFAATQALTQVDYGVGEYDTRRRYKRTTPRDETPDVSSDSYGSRHMRVEQEATMKAINSSSTPSRTGSGVWSAVGRAFDYMTGGGDGRDDRDGSGSSTESDDNTLNKLPSDHPTWRPPTDSELQEGTAGMASSSSSKRTPREGSADATCADTMADSRRVDTSLETESHDTKVPLSLTPMQPPPDVLAAMKGRVATGQRQQFSAPPADVAAAIGNAAERRKRDYVL